MNWVESKACTPLKRDFLPLPKQPFLNRLLIVQAKATSSVAEDSVRLAREAYRKYHATCFWYLSPDLPIEAEQLPMIIEGLRRHGNRAAFRLAQQICR